MMASLEETVQNIQDTIIGSPHDRAMNKYKERTREYPYRLGTGPSASEKYLSGERSLDMADARNISDAVPRLPDYAKPGNYNTDLGTPETEMKFQQWVKQNNIPFDVAAPVSDYDMRGFYKALQSGDPKAKEALNQNDNQIHFPDYWKTPYHKSFSNESQWADPKKAPKWNEQDQLVALDGRIVYDERAQSAQNTATKNAENKDTWGELQKWLGHAGKMFNAGAKDWYAGGVGRMLDQESKPVDPMKNRMEEIKRYEGDK